MTLPDDRTVTNNDSAVFGGEWLKVRELRFLEHEVYQFDDALQAGIAALPEGSVNREVLEGVRLMLRTAEPKEALFPAGFLDWVAAQVDSGAVDEVLQTKRDV